MCCIYHAMSPYGAPAPSPPEKLSDPNLTPLCCRINSPDPFLKVLALRLGTENSSNGTSAASCRWKSGTCISGNLDILDSGDLDIWKAETLLFWRPGNPEIWVSKNGENAKNCPVRGFGPCCSQPVVRGSQASDSCFHISSVV